MPGLVLYITETRDTLRRRKSLNGLHLFITINNFIAFKPFDSTAKEPLSYAGHTDPETL